jgi:hypothetical protein
MKPLTQAAALSFFVLALVLLPGRALAQTGWLDVTKPPFNAVPDDLIDDYPAIQAAANAMCPPTGSTGSVVYLPPGHFRVSHQVVFDCDGMVIGAGLGRSYITATDAVMDVFKTGVASTTHGNIMFRDFNIDTARGLTKTIGVGIQLGTHGWPMQKGARIENVGIENQYLLVRQYDGRVREARRDELGLQLSDGRRLDYFRTSR